METIGDKKGNYDYCYSELLKEKNKELLKENKKLKTENLRLRSIILEFGAAIKNIK